MLALILSTFSLLFATALSPQTSAPAYIVVLAEAFLALRRWTRERSRRKLLLRVLERARDLRDAGYHDRARELVLSAIRYELAARLSQPVNSDLDELTPALPKAWRDLLASGSADDLLRAAEVLLSDEPRPRLL